MKVNLEYHDNQSLTIEEVVAAAVRNYGSTVQVEISPESTLAYDYIYFGLQQLLTHSQISLLFEKNVAYQIELKKLRENIVHKVTEIIDQVIIDNEVRVE